ncbi:unnamed protein product [Orchesella dallaii]|uniref:Uncharacterized protein n=1 Tax=Orchesella dallaii TaxID=48710 RepID=A0ABP1QDS4_9HEXA
MEQGSEVPHGFYEEQNPDSCKYFTSQAMDFDTNVNPTRIPKQTSSDSASDEELIDKFEEEIDRKVDAIFQMAEQLDESNQDEFTQFQAFDDFDLNLMTNLNQGLRRKKGRNRLSFILVLSGILLVLAIAQRFLVSGVWIQRTLCKALINEPLCSHCYELYFYKDWIYCIKFD